MEASFSHHFVRHSIKKDRIKSIIDENLRAAHEAGIEVITLVCDQETTQWSYLRQTVNTDTPFVKHPITENHVFIIIDVSHCILKM